MKQPVVLRIYKGDALDAVRQFGQAQIVIGTTPDAQLTLTDDGVALLHAMIEDRDGEYYVSDLGSATGTFRNGQKLLEEKLEPGDELTIGAYRLQFFVGVPKPSAPPKGLTGAHPIEPPRAMAFTEQSQPSITLETEDAVAPPPPQPKAPVAEAPPAAPSTAAAPPPAPAPAQASASTAGTPGPAAKVGGVTPTQPHGHKKGKTFAPPNPYNSIGDIVKPSKGNVVEVLVTWNNKVLSSNHFSRTGSVFLSSDASADVVVPILSANSKYELVKLGAQVTILMTPEMTGDVTKENGEVTSFAELSRQSRIRNAGTHFELDLRQGEAARISLQNDLINLIVRFKAQTPIAATAPLLDMTSSELTGLLLAFAVALISGLYMNVITPSQLAEDETVQEEPVRLAKVQFKKQPLPETPPEPPKEAPKVEKKVVEVKDQKPQKDEKKEAKTAQKAAGVTSPGDPGKAGEPKPNPKATPKPDKVASSQPQGKSIKTGAKEGANMKSQKPDVNKTGLLSAFASKGAQKTLTQAYSGSGELQGMADSATGNAGSSETRAGDNFGSKLKDSTSGRGSSTVGISGVGTQGRGTGTTGYGTGGIGSHGSAHIDLEGSEGFSPGGMDREAIRRVIRDHLREIRSCYERELQRNPDLIGKLVLQWDIGEGGKVIGTPVVVSNALTKSVGECVSSHLRSWKFPDPPKDQIGRVVYPFVFSSQ